MAAPPFHSPPGGEAERRPRKKKTPNSESLREQALNIQRPTSNSDFPLPRAAANWMQRHVALRQAPSTRPLIEQATNGRPLSIKISGQGFVSKADNTAIVACSTKRKPDKQTNGNINPAIAMPPLTRGRSPQ